MTAIGKILTVVLTVASVLFMASALAVLATGPNWQAKASQVDGYAFARSGGENPQWTATDVSTGEDVKSAPTLADVIPAAVDAKVRKVQAEVTALNERKQQLESYVQVARATADTDAAALEARIARLRDRIQASRQQTVQAAGQLAAVNDQIGQVENQITLRRGDVFRLQTVLDQAELDAVRAGRLRGQLADLIVQLNADLEAARTRREQLEDEVGSEAPQPPSLTVTEPAAAPTQTAAGRGRKTTGDAL